MNPCQMCPHNSFWSPKASAVALECLLGLLSQPVCINMGLYICSFAFIAWCPFIWGEPPEVVTLPWVNSYFPSTRKNIGMPWPLHVNPESLPGCFPHPDCCPVSTTSHTVVPPPRTPFSLFMAPGGVLSTTYKRKINWEERRGRRKRNQARKKYRKMRVVTASQSGEAGISTQSHQPQSQPHTCMNCQLQCLGSQYPSSFPLLHWPKSFLPLFVVTEVPSLS